MAFAPADPPLGVWPPMASPWEPHWDHCRRPLSVEHACSQRLLLACVCVSDEIPLIMDELHNCLLLHTGKPGCILLVTSVQGKKQKWCILFHYVVINQVLTNRKDKYNVSHIYAKCTKQPQYEIHFKVPGTYWSGQWVCMIRLDILCCVYI